MLFRSIRSVGALPPDVELEDRRTVEVIDAGGQWIMPGLIDAHCHVSYGYPVIKGEGKGKGTTQPEFSTLKSARSVQKVLRSGVTSISVPGGTWFTDVGVRDAIKLGLMEGPRMYDVAMGAKKAGISKRHRPAANQGNRPGNAG